MTRNKPQELREDQVASERGKTFVREVKSVSGGSIFVYQWNLEHSDSSPLGLFVEPNNVAAVCKIIEESDAPRTHLQHGTNAPHGAKFDIATLTGFQGAHMEIYNSGKINVQWPRGKDNGTYEFVNSFLDVVELMSGPITIKVLTGKKNDATAKSLICYWLRCKNAQYIMC